MSSKKQFIFYVRSVIPFNISNSTYLLVDWYLLVFWLSKAFMITMSCRSLIVCMLYVKNNLFIITNGKVYVFPYVHASTSLIMMLTYGIFRLGKLPEVQWSLRNRESATWSIPALGTPANTPSPGNFGSQAFSLTSYVL